VTSKTPLSPQPSAKAQYEKPPELYDGLRLHQNENTRGCSPRVIEALARLRPEQIGFYPPYAAVTESAARYFGVATDQVTLVNGLDEGIMAVAIAYLRPTAGSGLVPEAIVPEPAFEIFGFDTAVAGGRVVRVMPNPDFRFAEEAVLAAITPQTRVEPSRTRTTRRACPCRSSDSERGPARARRSGRLCGRGARRVRRRSFIPVAAAPRVIVNARSRRRSPGGPADRRSSAPGHHRSARFDPEIRLNIAAASRWRRLRRPCTADALSRCRSRRRCCMPPRSARAGFGHSDATVCCPRRPHRRGNRRRAREGGYLRDRSSSGLRGCLRMGNGHVDHAARHLGIEVLCGAR
jgi:hypothetical protein